MQNIVGFYDARPASIGSRNFKERPKLSQLYHNAQIRCDFRYFFRIVFWVGEGLKSYIGYDTTYQYFVISPSFSAYL